MDFKDQIRQLGERVSRLKEATKTEEATKTAFVLPMLNCLGYDVFNPTEVVPEFVADIGIKKGEKIDYAIFQGANPVILIECKHWRENLNVHDGQLLRYFHVSKARFGMLTNGVTYRFYTDLDEPNKMDERPFFEFNVEDMKDAQIEELKKFHKSYFDIESIINTAGELKFTNAIKEIILKEFQEPSEALVKHFAKQVYPGVVTQKILEQFTKLVKRSLSQHISDQITERLKSALNREAETAMSTTQVEPSVDNTVPATEGPKIETTLEEMEAFYMIKSILRAVVEPQRIFFRDAQSYFSVILDDSNRKTICRLYLNGKKKQIGVFDSARNEVKTEIQSLDDLFNLTISLQDSAKAMLTSK